MTVIDEELDRLATDGLDDGELARIQARIAATLLTHQDFILGRTLVMAQPRAATSRIRRSSPSCPP